VAHNLILWSLMLLCPLYALLLVTCHFLAYRDDKREALKRAFPDTRPSLKWKWHSVEQRYCCVQHNRKLCYECGPFLEYLKEAHSWCKEDCEFCGLYQTRLPQVPPPPAQPKPRPAHLEDDLRTWWDRQQERRGRYPTPHWTDGTALPAAVNELLDSTRELESAMADLERVLNARTFRPIRTTPVRT